MNPFAVLGLDARPDLTDAQVRDAWRAVATATHPDREDGGNPAAYGAASAAYAALRTPWARSEAYADLLARTISPALLPADATPRPAACLLSALLLLPARIRHGRPLTLAIRTLLGLIVALAVLHSGADAAPWPAPWPASCCGSRSPRAATWPRRRAANHDQPPPVVRPSLPARACCRPLIVAAAGPVSMSYVLAALRALHIDTLRRGSNPAPAAATPQNASHRHTPANPGNRHDIR